MAEEALRQAHADLEDRVEGRTAELQRANEALRQSETNLQRAKDAAEAANQAKSIVFDTALDAIVTIDAHSIITAWNLQAETMFRWDKTEAVGMPLDETIIPQCQWEAHRREIEGFVKTAKALYSARSSSLLHFGGMVGNFRSSWRLRPHGLAINARLRRSSVTSRCESRRK